MYPHSLIHPPPLVFAGSLHHRQWCTIVWRWLLLGRPDYASGYCQLSLRYASHANEMSVSLPFSSPTPTASTTIALLFRSTQAHFQWLLIFRVLLVIDLLQHTHLNAFEHYILLCSFYCLSSELHLCAHFSIPSPLSSLLITRCLPFQALRVPVLHELRRRPHSSDERLV